MVLQTSVSMLTIYAMTGSYDIFYVGYLELGTYIDTENGDQSHAKGNVLKEHHVVLEKKFKLRILIFTQCWGSYFATCKTTCYSAWQ